MIYEGDVVFPAKERREHTLLSFLRVNSGILVEGKLDKGIARVALFPLARNQGQAANFRCVWFRGFQYLVTLVDVLNPLQNQLKAPDFVNGSPSAKAWLTKLIRLPI